VYGKDAFFHALLRARLFKGRDGFSSRGEKDGRKLRGVFAAGRGNSRSFCGCQTKRRAGNKGKGTDVSLWGDQGPSLGKCSRMQLPKFCIGGAKNTKKVGVYAVASGSGSRNGRNGLTGERHKLAMLGEGVAKNGRMETVCVPGGGHQVNCVHGLRIALLSARGRKKGGRGCTLRGTGGKGRLADCTKVGCCEHERNWRTFRPSQ